MLFILQVTLNTSLNLLRAIFIKCTLLDISCAKSSENFGYRIILKSIKLFLNKK